MEREDLHGFGGWLILLFIVYCVITPIAEAVALVDLVNGETADILQPVIPDWGAFIAAYCVLIVVEVAVLWFMGFRLIKIYNPTTVRIALIIIWINTLLVPPLGLFIMAFFTGYPFGEILGNAFADAPIEFIRPLIWAVIWTAYFMLSRRVANTYHDNTGDAGVDEVFS